MAEPTPEPRGWDLSSTCVEVDAMGNAHGRRLALAQTGATAVAAVLNSQAQVKFGAESPSGKSLLDALAAARDLDQLGRLGEALVEATSWDAWLTDVRPQPPADAFPEFFDEEDYNFEQDQPCIEVTMKVDLKGGGKSVVQMRLQKWYQPDLGEVLCKEAHRLQRIHRAPPMMLVILMWPSADGPAVTGRYRAKNAQGRKIDFRYQVQRAWEMDPMLTLSSPGTMSLLPLSKGAKERMPQLVKFMRKRLAEFKPDPDMLATVLTTFYWSLGMVCPLPEAHAVLGDLLPQVQAAPVYKKAYASACRHGYSRALLEGPIQAIRDLVRRQASRRFGADPAGLSGLSEATTREALEAIAERALTARDWTNLVARRAE